MLSRDYSWIFALSLFDGAFSNKDKKLPWRPNREDMSFFRQITTNGIVICTEGTLTSIIDLGKDIQKTKEVLFKNNREWIVLGGDGKYKEFFRYIDDETSAEIETSEKSVFVVGGRRAFGAFNDPKFIFLNLIINDLTKDKISLESEPKSGFVSYKMIQSSIISDCTIAIKMEKTK